MKNVLFVLLLTVSTAAKAEIVVKSWKFSEGFIRLEDDTELTNDEFLTWTTNDSKRRALKVDARTPTDIEASYYAESNEGEPAYDLSIGILEGSSFEQILNRLSDSQFRKSFEKIPESCPVETKAFLTVMDNLSGKLTGYCLILEVL